MSKFHPIVLVTLKIPVKDFETLYRMISFYPVITPIELTRREQHVVDQIKILYEFYEEHEGEE